MARYDEERDKNTEYLNGFIKEHCLACGGNWSNMLLTGIKRVLPEIYKKMMSEKDEGWDFFELADVVLDNRNQIESLDGWFTTSGGDATNTK
jgi:hypothetical protein